MSYLLNYIKNKLFIKPLSFLFTVTLCEYKYIIITIPIFLFMLTQKVFYQLLSIHIDNICKLSYNILLIILKMEEIKCILMDLVTY
nr:MAG TPA_asm: hypothetical protein [Caudoviricetes sp.]